MSQNKLLALRINTSNLETMLDLFKCFGVEFVQKKVSKAGSLFSGFFGTTEILVSDSLSARQAGQPLMSVRLQVEKIDEVWSRVKAVPGLETVMDLQELPSGKTAVVLDPDGRAFELVEAVL